MKTEDVKENTIKILIQSGNRKRIDKHTLEVDKNRIITSLLIFYSC